MEAEPLPVCHRLLHSTAQSSAGLQCDWSSGCINQSIGVLRAIIIIILSDVEWEQ